MLDVVLEDKVFTSNVEEIKRANIEGSEVLRTNDEKHVQKRKLPHYYDKKNNWSWCW
jgi:hypothetical protein